MVAVGAAGVAVTVTLIWVRLLSQLLMVCDTQKLVVPMEVVEGVGAPELPIPPLAAVYQSKLLPVAVSGDAV